MQQTVAGPFSGQNLQADAWQRLTTGIFDGPEIYLQGAGPAALQRLGDPAIASVALEWRADGVDVVLRGAEGISRLTVRSAIVHRPLPLLYDSLPLAEFDRAAQRFWQRVFGLMRVPGGRYLLRLIARRNRGHHTTDKA